ncbi:unnamed protein product [Phytomonas sp. Hart1]|nr:unnamed protein product [Phytomonas sp. Hart1]|eukprot:CCW65926.1 unnamed protein product [Phytomonas sp. isolate Hart1]
MITKKGKTGQGALRLGDLVHLGLKDLRRATRIRLALGEVPHELGGLGVAGVDHHHALRAGAVGELHGKG